MLTIEHLKYLASLAKLTPSKETLERFNSQSNDILKYIDIISKLETLDISALYTPIEVTSDTTRADTPIPTPHPKTLLTNAPETDGEFFIVPRII